MTEKMSNDNQFFHFHLERSFCAATAQLRKGLQFQRASTSEKIEKTRIYLRNRGFSKKIFFPQTFLRKAAYNLYR